MINWRDIFFKAINPAGTVRTITVGDDQDTAAIFLSYEFTG